jgi:hypothetical protein
VLSILRRLKSKALLDLEDYTVTNAALTASEAFAPAGMDVIGIFMDPGSTATGTAPTIAAGLQVTVDGESTWAAVPISEGSATASGTGAISTGSVSMYYVKAPVSESGVASDVKYRWVFTYANADNDFVALNCWVVGRKFNQRHP